MSTETGRSALVAALYDEQRLAANRAVLFHTAMASRAGINITDVSCLGVLDKEGPMTAGALARRVGVSRGGAITAVLDRLERAGFLRRQRDTADRRKVVVELVREDAYRALQGTLDAFSQSYRELIERYTEEELRLLLDFSRRANELVEAQTATLLEGDAPVPA